MTFPVLATRMRAQNQRSELDDGLTAQAQRLALAELELQLAGWSAAKAATAVRRAARWAARMAAKLPAAQRPAAFAALLEEQLAGAQAWLEGLERSVGRGDYAAGLERAARDGRLAVGMQKRGMEPGELGERWAAASPAAARAWEERMA